MTHLLATGIVNPQTQLDVGLRQWIRVIDIKINLEFAVAVRSVQPGVEVHAGNVHFWQRINPHRAVDPAQTVLRIVAGIRQALRIRGYDHLEIEPIGLPGAGRVGDFPFHRRK